MIPIGLQIGKGYAKAARGRSQDIVEFPAVAAPAPQQEYESEVASGPDRVSLNGHGPWIVGEPALVFAHQYAATTIDRERYVQTSFQAIARYALDQLVVASEPLYIMTGMPSAWYMDTTTVAGLTEALRDAAARWSGSQVEVVPEAAGVYYASLYEHGTLDPKRTRGSVGVIDAGYGDVNIALFHDGKYVAGESIPGGSVTALREIKKQLAQTYRLELSLLQVDAAVRANGVRLDGDWHPLPDGATTELLKSLEAIKAAARTLWPNSGRTLERVVLGGGGAARLAAPLRAAFPTLVVPYATLPPLPVIALNENMDEWPDADSIHQYVQQSYQLVSAASPQLIGPRGLAAAASTKVRMLATV